MCRCESVKMIHVECRFEDDVSGCKHVKMILVDVSADVKMYGRPPIIRRTLRPDVLGNNTWRAPKIGVPKHPSHHFIFETGDFLGTSTCRKPVNMAGFL